jgi:hypothetical protein
VNQFAISGISRKCRLFFTTYKRSPVNAGFGSGAASSKVIVVEPDTLKSAVQYKNKKNLISSHAVLLDKELEPEPHIFYL